MTTIEYKINWKRLEKHNTRDTLRAYLGKEYTRYETHEKKYGKETPA